MNVQCVACRQYVGRGEAYRRTVELEPGGGEVLEWFVCVDCRPLGYPDSSDRR